MSAMTQKQLTEKFNEFNAKFFEGAIKDFKVFPHKTLKTRLGMCSYRYKIIQVDETLDETASEEVLLHEMVHAYIGIGHGHDKLFNSECERIENLTGLSLRPSKKAKEEAVQKKNFREREYSELRHELIIQRKKQQRGEWNSYKDLISFVRMGYASALTKSQIKRLLSEFSA